VGINFYLPGNYLVKEKVYYNQMWPVVPDTQTWQYAQQVTALPANTENLVTTLPRGPISCGNILQVNTQWTSGSLNVTMDPSTMAQENVVYEIPNTIRSKGWVIGDVGSWSFGGDTLLDS